MANPFESAAEEVKAGADPATAAFGLVAEMTLEEKLDCLDGDTDFWPGIADMVAGGYHAHTWPAAAVPRLGIPGIEFADGPRGCVVGTSTCFPVSMARGATFDPELEERIGDAMGKELRAAGATYTGAVCMNVLRHLGWGRAQETYGEDPHHIGEMAAALTRGLQRHVMACMKHFALNSIEEDRFRVDITVGERALHEVYLPHFRRVAGEGVASVMSAYNSVNGEWCGENATLLTQVLRDEWHWEGFVTSDFIAGLRDAVKSVTAGLDIEMPFRQQRQLALHPALESGELSEEDVDERVRTIVATFLRFAHVFRTVPPESVLACPEHRALARETAARAMVLVRNEGDLLPIDPSANGRIAVLGRLAAIPNLGDSGSSRVIPPYVVTLLEGIRGAFPNASVEHSSSDPSVAEDAGIAFVVVGLTRNDEGEFIDLSAQASMMQLFPPPPSDPLPPTPSYEIPATDLAPEKRAQATGFASGGDRRNLCLSEEDESLIRTVAARCERTVVILMGGSGIVMPWLEEVQAALVAWYPGMEGGHALGDVLTGVVEPSGRLPFAIPTSSSHLVDFEPDADATTYDLFHGQWKLHRDGNAAHLPFGWGLGYTIFRVGEVTSSPESLGWTGRLRLEIANTGSRAGSTVIQLYGSKPASHYERPLRRLVGFALVTLEAGGSREVAVPYDLTTLAVRDGGGWVFEEGPWSLTAGQHADDIAAIVTFDPPRM